MSLEFALKHTTSILEKKPPRDVDPAGSAVLISISDEIYLVTAAHLLNLETWALLTMPGSDNSMINFKNL